MYTQAEVDSHPRNEHGVKVFHGKFFGNGLRFPKNCTFGEECSFGEACSFGEWCSFGEQCSFGEGCSFEGCVARSGYPYIAIDGAGSTHRKTYFFNLETGIRVRSGCFAGTLDEFRAKVKADCPDSTELKRMQYLGMANIAAVTFGGEVE